MLPLYKSSDNVVEWDKLKNVRTGSYENAATLTFTLKDADGAAVSGATAVSMSYVTGSDGKYQGTLQSTVSLGDPGTTYFLELTATRGSDVAFRRIQCEVQYKGEQ